MSSENLGEYVAGHIDQLVSVLDDGYTLAKAKPDYHMRAGPSARLDKRVISYDWRLTPEEEADLNDVEIKQFVSSLDAVQKERFTRIDATHRDLAAIMATRLKLTGIPITRDLDREFYYRMIPSVAAGEIALTASRVIRPVKPHPFIRRLSIVEDDNDFRADGLTITEAPGSLGVSQAWPEQPLPSRQDLINLYEHFRVLSAADRRSP